MAQDLDMQQGDTPSRAPISAHPAFPLLVGLWFAALLGLGTIVLPSGFLEKAVGVTGLPIDAPLSLGARATFAVLAALVGLAGGLVFARRLAEKHAAGPRIPRHRALGDGRSVRPRPLSVHDDLGEEAISPSSEEEQAPRRRRALTVSDIEPADDLEAAAPLYDSEAYSFVEPARALEVPEAAAESDAPEVREPAPEVRKPRNVPVSPFVPVQPIDGPLEELGIVQLVERLGRSMQRLAQAKLQDAAPLNIRPAVIGGDGPQGAAVIVPPPVVPEALRAFMDGPIERFAPAPAEQRVAVTPRPLAFDVYGGELDDGEDEEDAFDPGSFTLPLASKPARPFDAPIHLSAEELADDEDEIEEEDPGNDESFSSLLSMKQTFHSFVSSDSPEAAHEPDDEFGAPQESAASAEPARSHASPDPVETERALRSALANLQRMSGAA